MSLPVPDNQQDSVDAAVFQKAQVVSIAEVGPFLKSLDSTRKNVNATHETRHEMQLAMSYCNQFTHTKDQEVTAAIRRTVTKYNVSAYNLGLIMNLAPESVEELKTLIPSLDPAISTSPFVKDDDIQQMLDELRVFRQVDFG